MCPTSAVSRVGTHPISGIVETIVICHSTLSNFIFLLFLIPGIFHLRGDVTGLSMSTSLETRSLQFQSPSISPRLGRSTSTSDDTLCPPGSYLFPVEGISEYLEDLVARIGAPRFNS